MALNPVYERPALPATDDVDVLARALAIRAFDGHRAIGAWSMLWLLPDRLDLFRSLYSRHLDVVGPLEHALGDRGSDGWIGDDADGAFILGRIRLLERVLQAWRQGRGRVVTWEDVEAARVVTPAFEDALREALRTHAADAHAFVEAVRATPRFRADKVERLREVLVERGCLDEAARLSPDDIAASALIDTDEVADPHAGAVVAMWLSRLMR